MGFILGKPERLFESEDLRWRDYSTLDYDVSADGERFVITAPAEDENAPTPAIRVVQNWHEEFNDSGQDQVPLN